MIENKEELLSNKTILCGYLMRRDRHLATLNAKISRALHKKIETAISLLQRKTLTRKGCEFVKVGYVFVEKVSNFNSQRLVKVELHQSLPRVKAKYQRGFLFCM